jgi:hypothetical protein
MCEKTGNVIMPAFIQFTHIYNLNVWFTFAQFYTYIIKTTVTRHVSYELDDHMHELANGV